MKTNFLIAVALLLSVSEVYSQFKVNVDGSAQFKVGSYIAGFTGSSSSSSSNVSFGYRALNNPSVTQNFNVAFGNGALYSNATGFGNTATGGEALYLNTGGYFNTANGLHSLYSNTSGYGNTAIGNQSLYSNTSGYRNTATGNDALTSNTTGSSNTAYGDYSLPSNTIGSANTAIGGAALPDNTMGTNNTAVGDWSLRFNTTGSYNTAIGSTTNFNAGNYTNATVVGYQATATSSNQVRLGNTSVSSIGGYAAWSNLSDGRAKKNVKADVPGLNFIRRLKPVTYNLDLDAIDALLKIDKTDTPNQSQGLTDIEQKAREAKQKQVQTGFIAQDVEEMAKSIGYNFSGVDVDESGIYGLRYAEFVVPLVKAVQELSEQNERLQEQINELKNNATFRSATNETGTSGMVSPVIEQCKLSQNAPNPFTSQTEIKYFVAAGVKDAYIYIFDMQGKMLKKINAAAGQNSITIQGSTLQAGIYLYSLVADGQEVDTKRMILTK